MFSSRSGFEISARTFHAKGKKKNKLANFRLNVTVSVKQIYP